MFLLFYFGCGVLRIASSVSILSCVSAVFVCAHVFGDGILCIQYSVKGGCEKEGIQLFLLWQPCCKSPHGVPSKFLVTRRRRDTTRFAVSLRTYDVGRVEVLKLSKTRSFFSQVR